MHGRSELTTFTPTELAGSIRTELLVMEGSSSDSLELEAGLKAQQVRDVITAIPVLVWEQGGDLDRSALESAALLELVDVHDGYALPMTLECAECIQFTVEDGCLQFSSRSRNLGFLAGQKFKIHDRMAWFLGRCDSISIVITSSSVFQVRSISNDGMPPRVAVHRGSFDSKQYAALMAYSTNWAETVMANTSLYAGSVDDYDHHSRTYLATPEEVDIPQRIVYRGSCLGCGGAGRSIEHCTPNWIATEHKVVPVTAPIFCAQCNGHFGNELEDPMSNLIRSGGLAHRLGSDLFIRWAIKTALALSVASDSPIDYSWMRAIRLGQVPEGFRVFAETTVEMTPGYMYTVTQFSRSFAEKGAFLVTYAMDGLVFIVLRDATGATELPEWSQVHPSVVPRKRKPEAQNFNDLHFGIMKSMTGHEMGHVESPAKPVRSKR
jgi:hypothetical protein